MEQQQNQELEQMEIELEKYTDDLERGGFVSKVFGIVGVQLSITCLFCVLAMTEYGAEFFVTHIWLGISMMIVNFLALIPLACSPRVARTVPLNYILLMIFTTSEGYVAGLICAYYTPESVLLTLVICTFIVFSLSFYAFVAKENYTALKGSLLVLLSGFIIFVFITIIGGIPMLDNLWSILGSIMFGLYLILDIQMIARSESSIYSVDDYVLAAMNVYMDVINILLYLLRILGEKR